MTEQDQRLGRDDGAVTTPPQPESFPAPGQASYISPPGVSRRRESGAGGEGSPRGRGPLLPDLGEGPESGQGSSHRLRPARAGPPGFRFPALALPQPQKPTHRHHNKGGDAAATPGWEDWGTTVGLAARPLAEQRARPPVPVGAAREQAAGWKRWGCLEVLLTLVRQLVELRHLERAAPLFQRLPAAVHCGAETVFAREVRMRSSLPAAPRRTAPATAGGGRPGSARARPGRGAPSGAAPRPCAPSTAGGRRQEGRSERPVSRRPCPGPAPERGGRRAGSQVPPAPLPARAARPLRGSLPARGSRLALQLRELQAVCSQWGKGGKVGGKPGRAEAGQGGGTCGPGAGKEALRAGSRYPGGSTRS